METITKQPAATSTALFRPFDFFMLRSPVLSMETFLELFPPVDLEAEELRENAIRKLMELSQDPVIREAIAVSSPSLLASLPNLSNRSNPRKQEQAIHGFLRYLLRMISRPTPFGLFSGVTCGTFAERSALSLLDVKMYKKRSRPDMEWLLKILEQLEANPEVVSQLRVRTNSMFFYDGSRAKLPYITRYGQKDEQGRLSMDAVSVRATPVVHFVMNEAQEPVLFSDLLDRITSEYQGFPQETIHNFLLTLFRQEFLISELRPPTTNPAPFDYLLERVARLQGVEEIKQKMLRIADRLLAYDAMPLGEGEKIFLELCDEMNELSPSKHPLQVDLALAANTLTLHSQVGEEAAKAASLLWKLSPPRMGVAHLASYRMEFLEKYGLHREVPLLELLDEDRGLGAPAGYEFPQSRRPLDMPPRSDEKRLALQANWIAQALAQGSLEVELTEEMAARLAPEEQHTNALPASLELYFTIAAGSQESLDRGDYQLHLGPMPGSAAAGQTFGRFADLFDEDLRQHLADVRDAEQAFSPDALLVEVAFLPAMGRATNIVMTENNLPYEIAMGTNPSLDSAHTLPLSDLLVGCTEHHFYLKSRSLNREVIPKAGHMLNYRVAPNLYRFLREVALEQTRTWAPFRWEVMTGSPFLPRLRYGKAILTPATWQLNELTSDLRRDMPEAEWQAVFGQWRSAWKVPRYVYVVEMDNRILLDLDHPLHLKMLQKEFAQGTGIKLTEMGAGFDEQCVRGATGPVMNEVVIPLVKTVQATRKPLPNPHLPLIATEERLNLPGSEWYFFKLYGISSRQEELIGGQLHKFCLQAAEQGLVEKSYFIRYADPSPHIRLRFNGQPGKLAAELFPLMHQWAQGLQKEGLLSHMVVDTYDPEIERYGGPALMKKVETLFAKDSTTVASWIFGKRFQNMRLSLDLIGAISVIDYLENFGLSFSEQFRWLDARVAHKEHLDEFRQHRQLLLSLANSADDWAGLRAHPEGGVLYAGIGQRRAAVRDYAQAVRETEAQGALYNSFDGIVASVIHLHLNRLLGTDRMRERKVMTLARHTLNALRHFREGRS